MINDMKNDEPAHTLCALLVNMIHGAVLHDFERDYVIETAARYGVEVTQNHLNMQTNINALNDAKNDELTRLRVVVAQRRTWLDRVLGRGL